jgi:iron complex transport system ATP-binding protein
MNDGPRVFRPALEFSDVTLRWVPPPAPPALDGIDWTVEPGERWVVLGPNGSGKTTLVQLAGGHIHPTVGRVTILGQRVGRVDLRILRTRIGFVSAAVARSLRPGLAAADVVMSGRYAALETWWQDYTDDDRRRARGLLEQAGFAHVAERPFGVISEGERQQVLLARALMGRPELILLDEPAAGLDVGGRERLVRTLARLAGDPETPPLIFVTHHVEEIPPAFTSALLVRHGHLVASGPVDEVLTSESLSACFGLALRLRREEGRWTCRAG